MGLLDNQTQLQYQNSGNLGGYQFTSLQNIIDQFIIAYVGESKIIPKVRYCFPCTESFARIIVWHF